MSNHCVLKLASWQGLKAVAELGRVRIVNKSGSMYLFGVKRVASW